MTPGLHALLVPAAVERLVLVVNHVLASEPVAMQRLAPHRDRTIELELLRWPAWLPTVPLLRFRITPPGLLEWCGLDDTTAAALSVQVDAAHPALLFARSLAGETPALTIVGDAALAGDVRWLVDHLRWDVEADLERVFGPVAARQLGRLGSSLAAGLRTVAQRTPWSRPQHDRAGGPRPGA